MLKLDSLAHDNILTRYFSANISLGQASREYSLFLILSPSWMKVIKVKTAGAVCPY